MKKCRVYVHLGVGTGYGRETMGVAYFQGQHIYSISLEPCDWYSSSVRDVCFEGVAYAAEKSINGITRI